MKLRQNLCKSRRGDRELGHTESEFEDQVHPDGATFYNRRRCSNDCQFALQRAQLSQRMKAVRRAHCEVRSGREFDFNFSGDFTKPLGVVHFVQSLPSQSSFSRRFSSELLTCIL